MKMRLVILSAALFLGACQSGTTVREVAGKDQFTRLEGAQRVKAETVNGRVMIKLPENADVEVSADTLNGSINGRDFGLETDKGFVGSDLNGKIGSGSARLNIDTVNGSIRIRSK